MEAIQQQQPPTDAAMSPGPRELMAAASRQPSAHEVFTPPELDVVETLRRLNEPSASTGGTNATAASGSSSPRSVNDAPPTPELGLAQELAALPSDPATDGYADEDGDDEEVSGSQRRKKRYRPIAEIYRATARFARFNIKNKKE